MATKIKKTHTRKKQKILKQGRIYITATFNNTLITITDNQGNAVLWGSTGKSGFKGSRKSTPYAATTAITETLNRAKEFGLSQVSVFIKGPGPGRDAALRVLRNTGIKIIQITDITPIPHNGTRPRKQRRG